MYSRVSILLCSLAILLLAACSSEEPVGPDAGDNDVDAPGDDCIVQADCADDEYCHDEQCHSAPECGSTGQWQQCVAEYQEVDEILAHRAHCDGQYCRIACLSDDECADGQLCTDDGYCREFTGQLTGEHPGGDGGDSLQAGFGSAPLNVPIGISLGGFADRDSNAGGRYADSLGASHGAMHELDASAVAVDDGQRQLLFMRAPIIFPTMAVHEQVSRALQDETGSDWRSSLVISATHTHSGPARFWQIPEPDRTLGGGLGQFGIGDYHEHVFDWLVDSMTEAALDAIDDLSPAKMGWEVVEAFDTDDVITRDRWGEVPPFDDSRALVMRIDDPDDNPRGVLVSFGTHPTVHSGSYATDDVISGAEARLEQALGETYDRHVPVMYFQQNGGTMTARGNQDGHSHTQRFENFGAHLVDRTFADIEDIETTDDWTFAGHTHRFPILHEYLEYADGEFDDYIHGGFQCGISSGDDYHDHTAPDDYGCLGFHQILEHRPLTLVTKSQISAFQLNDLTLVTMPGELSMPLGWQIQKHLEKDYGIDPFDSFTWGFAQDHLLYLLPTNLRGDRPPFPGMSLPDDKAPDDYPDYAFSFLQGGYEAGMSPWGHNLGDFLVERAVEAVGIMRGEEGVEPRYPVPYPEQHSRRGHEPFATDTTSANDVGTITEAPSDEVERREFVEFAWLGGDPKAEMPQAPRVTLERLNGESDEFEAVVSANNRPYDNREFVMLTRHRRDDDDRHEWVVYWEETADFPTGTYRFRVDGHYFEDEDGDPVAYQTHTDPFELTVSTQLLVDEWTVDDEHHISFELFYPPAQALDVAESAPDRGAPTGSYRMHHRDVPSGEPIFVDAGDVDDVDVQFVDATPSVDIDNVEIVTDDEADVPVTDIRIATDRPLNAGEEIELDLQVTDRYGNTATASETMEYTP